MRELLSAYEEAIGFGIAAQFRALREQLKVVTSQSRQWQQECARHKQEIKWLKKRMPA